MTLDLLALKPLCSPRRGPSKKKPLTITRAAFFARIKEALKHLPAVERKLKELSPEDQAVHQPALHFVRSVRADAIPDAADVEVQACIAHVMGGFDKPPILDALLPFWLETKGPAFALHALVRSSEGYPAMQVFGANPTCHWERVDKGDWRMRSVWPAWELMDAQLCILPDAAWTEAHAKAAEVRTQSSIAAQCALAYLFRESEPGWAKAAAEAWFASEASPTAERLPFAAAMLIAATDDLKLAEKLVADATKSGALADIGDFVADFAQRFGDAALPSLIALFQITEQPKETWSWARNALIKVGKVLACFDDARVTEMLVALLDDKSFGPTANEHLTRFPRTALRVLAPSLSDKSKKAERRVALLDTLLRTHPDIVRTVLPELDASLARALEKRAPKPNEVGATSAEAPRSAWPKVLAEPMWRGKQARQIAPVLQGLVVPEGEAHLALDKATKAKWTTANDYIYRVPRAQQEAMLERARASTRTTKGEAFNPFLGSDVAILNAASYDEDILEAMWNAKPFSSNFDLRSTEIALFRLGERAIAGTLARLEVEPNLVPAAAHIDATKVSIHLARALRKPSLRAIVHRAFARFSKTHALALIPVALQGEGKDAELAATALRWLAANGERDALNAAAQTHGDAAARALDALLAFDPLELCPLKPPRLSEFADPVALPPVRLRDGAYLPTEAVRNLLEMLQFSPQDPPYAGIADVVQACDRASLDAFAWALLQAWDRAGGSSANAWALHALGHLGSDSVVKLLAAEIRRWPREKAKPRALLGLDVLARMGTDVALLHLDELSKKARNRDVEAKAKELLAQVAETRGLSPEDLEDRLVPTLELDGRGARQLSVGPRVLKVQFNEALVPYLVDAEGKRADKITKAKGDDADALKQAQDAWKELRGDAAQIAKALIGRLERAMCEERRWDNEDFRSLFIAHPLTRQLATRLIWGVFADDEGTQRSTFRIAEDGSLASLDDALLTLKDAVSLGIVHPYYLDEAERTAWAERFAEYEILQPFEQLGRRVERVQKGAEKETPWASAQGKMVGLGPLLGAMEARGWRVASPDGDGLMDHMTRMFGTKRAAIGFAPGFRPREARPERVQISVSLGSFRTCANIPPIAYAEITRDLASLGLM